MAIKDFFDKAIHKAEDTAEETVVTLETEAEETAGEVQEAVHGHGHRPPEPPKDENGNPIQPPEGFRPPFEWNTSSGDETNTENAAE